MISLTIIFLAAFPACWATSSRNYTIPQKIELDLVLPRNATFAPTQQVPLLWGLQNANFAWDMAMRLSWQLERIDQPLGQTEEGTFPRQNYTGALQNYTDLGTAPADPLFLYYFPESLRNATAGQWKLSWKFGFELTCSTTNVSELFYYQFDHLQPTEVIFSVDEGGESASFDRLNSSCPDSSVSTTYEIVDYRTVRDHCPILNETAPEATPCALKSNQSLVDEMNAGAASNCSSQDWDIFSDTCQTGEGAGVTSLLRGLLEMLMTMVFGVSLLIAAL
ncbi:hypothetical protein BDW60DRAFT_226863 [Aspergillus nidulans var. acristatus]